METSCVLAAYIEKPQGKPTLVPESDKCPAMNTAKMILWRNMTMSKNAKMTNPMKVITGPNTRWSYVNVWEPKSINGGTPKYSISLIIPKSDAKTVTKIEAAIETEVLTIYRKFVMVSLLVVRLLLNLTLQLMTTMIFLTNGGDKLWKQL